MTKNVGISLVLLLFQIFYTFVIVVGWYNDLVDMDETHHAFKMSDSSQLLKSPGSLLNSTADFSDKGFGDIDIAKDYRENLIETPEASTLLTNGVLKLFILFIILSETQVDAI